MGKKDKNRLRGAGAEKTVQKTNKKLEAKQKKMLQKLGEVRSTIYFIYASVLNNNVLNVYSKTLLRLWPNSRRRRLVAKP